MDKLTSILRIVMNFLTKGTIADDIAEANMEIINFKHSPCRNAINLYSHFVQNPRSPPKYRKYFLKGMLIKTEIFDLTVRYMMLAYGSHSRCNPQYHLLSFSSLQWAKITLKSEYPTEQE